MASSNNHDRDDAMHYVRRISSDIHDGALELVAENERLRVRLADDAAEIECLRVELDAARSELGPARQQREAADERFRRLEDECQSLRVSIRSCEQERARLRNRLLAADEENRRFADDFVRVTLQNSNLANLYVSAYRLHATLDRSAIVRILQEILADLVGSEEMALFELADGLETLRLTDWKGIDPESWHDIRLGEGVIGQVAATGKPFFRASGDESVGASGADSLSVCIPLLLEDRVCGALAVFRLLPQKAGIEPIDVEIFELLGTHAATALHSALLHADAMQRADARGPIK